MRVVERRSSGEAAVADWFADASRVERLAELVGPMGRPDWAIDVVLVDDTVMTELNAGYRQVPGVTDVLSFSYLTESGDGSPDLAGGRSCAFRDLWSDLISGDTEDSPAEAVGEVVLAPRFVAERCREREWPLDHEMPLLVVHGIMHILGWDHADDAQSEAMQAVEEEVLAAGGLPHPLRERS